MSKRSMMISVLALVALVFVGSCALVVSNLNRGREEARQAQKERRERRGDRVFAGELVRDHVMSMDEGMRYQQITHGVIRTHAISDADLDWMLMMLVKPVDQTNATSLDLKVREMGVKMIDLGTLRLVRKTTPQQQDKVFKAMLPFLYGSDSINKSGADSTLAAFGVTRAIPYIQPHLQDSNSNVRRDAGLALRDLNIIKGWKR